MPKALASGDIIADFGYYKTIVEAKVDTIIVSDATCFKYRVYDEIPTGRNHHLAFQVFIGDTLVEDRTNVHKFMTKTQFKELLTEHLGKCLKREMGLLERKADPPSL